MLSAHPWRSPSSHQASAPVLPPRLWSPGVPLEKPQPASLLAPSLLPRQGPWPAGTGKAVYSSALSPYQSHGAHAVRIWTCLHKNIPLRQEEVTVSSPNFKNKCRNSNKMRRQKIFFPNKRTRGYK